MQFPIYCLNNLFKNASYGKTDNASRFYEKNYIRPMCLTIFFREIDWRYQVSRNSHFLTNCLNNWKIQWFFTEYHASGQCSNPNLHFFAMSTGPSMGLKARWHTDRAAMSARKIAEFSWTNFGPVFDKIRL